MITNQFNSQLDSVVLTGNDLTIADVINVAKNNVEVRLAPEVKGMIINERELLMKVIRNSPPIYGVTRGVGANKNIEVPQDLISEYQTRILLSHCVGVPPYYSEEIVRAIMVVRANSLAKGGSGVQPEILEMFVNMLNHQIHPQSIV